MDFDRQQKARKKYLEQIYEDLEALVAPSAKVATNVLKIAKLSEEVFDASMDKHLDLNARGGQNVLRHFEISMISPNNYLGSRDVPELKTIFFKAADWALYQVTHSKQSGTFLSIMKEYIGNDLLDS